MMDEDSIDRTASDTHELHDEIEVDQSHENASPSAQWQETSWPLW